MTCQITEAAIEELIERHSEEFNALFKKYEREVRKYGGIRQ